MKFFRFFAVILALFASTALFGADELPADPKPMDMINFLRQAAIKNDASMALQVMHGPMAEQMIRTGKMPKELRQMMLDLTAAFEDTYIRATGDKALVYIFVTQDNKEKCFKVRFDPIAGGVLRIVEFAPGTIPGARVYLDRFIAACKDGKQNLFHAYLSDALKTQFPAIPQSLQLDGQVNISQVKNSANEAIFAVKYLGITGNIKLTRVAGSLFWEITEIDPILTAPLPREILARLAAYTGVYARQRDVVLDGVRQKAAAETNAKRAAKLRFYEEAKTRAQNDEALKNEVGKPEQVMRDFIEKIYTPKMLNGFKNYVAEEINYFENIISATEAEVEVEFKEIIDGSKRHDFCKYKLRKDGDSWQIVTREDDSSRADTQDTEAEWISEVSTEELVALMTEILEVAVESTGQFFIDGFFNQEMFSDTDVTYSLFQLLSECSQWQSQTGQNGELVVTVKNPENDETTRIIFARVGNEWKIKAVPAVKPQKKEHKEENNAESSGTNAE